MNNFDKFLMTAGSLFLVIVSAIILLIIWNGIKYAVSQIHIWYLFRHRFGKSPTAKCYCKDCRRWGVREDAPTEGKCEKFNGWHTADCWFCWDAEPRKRI